MGYGFTLANLLLTLHLLCLLFFATGSQIDDHVPKRASARILAPPGGRSSGIW